MYLRARHYDPSLGRFLSRDTWTGDPLAGQTQNRYTYVANDPLTQTDPSGHCGIDAALDIGFIGMSAGMLISGPEKDRGTNALALGADVISLAIPCATGLGMLIRGGRALDNVGDAVGGIGRVDDLLRPGGELIGQAGAGRRIREVTGSTKDAEDLFLSLAGNGRDVTPADHIGMLVKLESGGVIGYRPVSRSIHPTIDVNMPGIEIREIKFKP